MDIVAIRKRLGLKQRELAALFGECHTTLVKIEQRPEHRPITNGMYWFIEKGGVDRLCELLDMWVELKPKNLIQVRILVRLARRLKGEDGYSLWKASMEEKHPEFFSEAAS